VTATRIENLRDTAGRRRVGGAEVQIEGLEETLKVLRGFEPEILKGLNKAIRASLTNVKKVAEMSVREAGHAGGNHYSVRMRSTGARTGGSIRAVSKEAAIFEFAGTKGRSKTGGPITPQGAAMVRWLDSFGRPGRFLWDSWDLQQFATDRNIRKSIADAEAELQHRLDAAGERY
jgi:hypothetical protein